MARRPARPYFFRARLVDRRPSFCARPAALRWGRRAGIQRYFAEPTRLHHRPGVMPRLKTVLLALMVLSACGGSTVRGAATLRERSDKADDVAVSSTAASTTAAPTTAALSSALPDEQFQLYTHCGINGAMIDGVWWRSASALSDGNGNPPSGWGNPYQSGFLHFLDESMAVFRASNANLSVTLQRTDSTDFPFICS